MKILLYLTIISICFLGCERSKNEVKAKIQTIQHKDLLWSRQRFLAEYTGEDNQYDSIKNIAIKKPIVYKISDDLIIVSAYFERDACGEYNADIKINNDSLFLNFNLISDVLCTSLAYYKVDYLINNSSKTRYIIAIE